MAAISEIATILRPDRFYSFQNQLIYEAMLSLYKQNVAIDMLSLINELTKQGKLEQAGGNAYIADLTKESTLPDSETQVLSPVSRLTPLPAQCPTSYLSLPPAPFLASTETLLMQQVGLLFPGRMCGLSNNTLQPA